MRQVNLGLIGLGKWPREAYLPNLEKMPHARVVAVAARSDETREFARSQFGGSVTTHADYRDLLADSSVEAVLVAVPNPLHAEVVQAAAASGKHVFFEPPVGLDAGQIQATLAALEQTPAVVQADHELRYVPVVAELQRRIAEGLIGEPLMARVRLWTDWGFGGTDWGEDVESQGFFLWLGCWYLDLLDCIFPHAPLRAEVVGGRAANGGLMDHGWALLEYPGHRTGAIEFNLVNCAGQDISLHVLGSAGEIWAEVWEGTLRWRTGLQWQETSVPCAQPPHGFAGMYESIAGFLQAVADGGPVAADLASVKRIHQAALLCRDAEMGAGE